MSLIVTMANGQQVEHKFSSGSEMAKWAFLYRPDLMRGVTND